MSLETDPEFVNVISEDWLGPLPPGNREGDPIDVTYSYDDNGIMLASFLEVSSGIKKEISISEFGASGSIDID